MNIPPTDDDLARAHAAFRRNHEAGRARLLERLSDEDSTTVTKGSFSMKVIFREITSDWSLRRPGRTIGKAVLAAALLVAVAMGFHAWFGERQAYALDDLPQRLMELRSIYMTGWQSYPRLLAGGATEPGPKLPITMFAERPNCYWATDNRFSVDKDHPEGRVSPGYRAGSGREQLAVSSEQKLATVSDVPPLWNELQTEMSFQSFFSEMLSGGVEDFAKTRSEVVNDIPCDVYERAGSAGPMRFRVWLNPKTGLPVKIGRYEVDKSDTETPFLIIDHVEVNVSAGNKGLSFAPPEGYEVKHDRLEASPELIVYSEASSRSPKGSLRLATSFALNIDDKAALICWSGDLGSDEKKAADALKFSLGKANLGKAGPGEGRECDHVEVSTATVGGHDWNWSLVFPKKKGERLGDDMLQIVFDTAKSGAMPLRCSAEGLAVMVEKVQLVSKTVPEGDKPFTLATLRARLRDLP
jgi:hypothetical protein